MHGGREKLHILLQSKKTCICLSDRYKFSPHSSQTTHLLIGFNYIQVPPCIPWGKIFKGGELETNVQVISLLKLFTSKNYKITL